MWHGGISGENSFYMHGSRPLRTPDKTSPYLHELFHVLQPFRPAGDADWLMEGLAEGLMRFHAERMSVSGTSSDS